MFIFYNEGNFTPEQFCKRLVFVFNNLLIDNLVEHPLAYQSPYTTLKIDACTVNFSIVNFFDRTTKKASLNTWFLLFTYFDLIVILNFVWFSEQKFPDSLLRNNVKYIYQLRVKILLLERYPIHGNIIYQKSVFWGSKLVPLLQVP